MLSFALRAETVRGARTTRSIKTRLIEWTQHEFKLCITHEKLELNWKDENIAFIFGTITFSSLAFIGKLFTQYLRDKRLRFIP
jgi:hypothetical protein